MISVNGDSGSDIILELLRQSQAIRAAMQKEKEDEAPKTKEVQPDNSHHPRASLRSPDTDGSLMLSRKDQYANQRRKDESYNKIKNWIEDILNRMTAQDYKRLSESGFQVEDLTVEALTHALQLIKDYEEINTDSREKSAEKNKEKAKSKTSATISEEDIKNRMEGENLPVTKESVERVKGALKLSEDIPNIDKKDILYLLCSERPPTIENLYKARYSSQRNEPEKRLSDAEWTELIPQVSEFINKAGAAPDADILEGARWLVENNIPLSKENINLLTGLEELTDTYDADRVFDKIIEGMKEGTLPGEVILIDKEKLLQAGGISETEDTARIGGTNIKQLIEDTHRISDDDIVRTVQKDQDITIKNLTDTPKEDVTDKELPEDRTSREEQSAKELSEEQMLKVLRAKRQLEEIRLRMTAEAALRLEKKGFDIDTHPLEEVVDRLRLEEEHYCRELFHQIGAEPDENEIRLLQSTNENINELKFMPASILGMTLRERSQQTVSTLVDAGRSILPELEKAKEAYEALFTQPRAEYGDSIKKAFGNMDSLMEEMGIEDTEYNRRAIRILGYNRMDINNESIEQVKAYDFKVNYLLKNMNPEAAVRIIKDGINPLDLPIEELNDRIEALKEQGYSSLDKYSSYLYKLEREDGISGEQRKAYIGIYRLLHQIEKSDGAALGAVIKSDNEVTLSHLLTALRTSKKGGMDYRVDDEFGTLQDVSFKSESITEQLKAVFNKEGNAPGQYSPNQQVQDELQKAVIKELLNGLTPGHLNELHQSIRSMTSNPNKEAGDIWNTLGNIPLEQLLDQIRKIQAPQGEEQAYYYDKLRELRDIYRNSDQAIRFLNDFKLPCTTTNLVMAGQVLSSSGTVFKKLFGLAQEEKNEKSETNLKKKLELSDTLIDRNTMDEAYEELELEVQAVINKEAAEEPVNSYKLTQLKNMGIQMHFIKTLAKREFYQIPVETAGKITNVNLTIIRDKASAGKVSVTLNSDRLGSIKAEASLKDKTLNGYVACDHIESLKLLERQTERIKSAMREEEITVKQLNFCLQQAPDTVYAYQKSWDSGEEQNPETERILYRVAKVMIDMIRLAEESDAEVA